MEIAWNALTLCESSRSHDQYLDVVDLRLGRFVRSLVKDKDHAWTMLGLAVTLSFSSFLSPANTNNRETPPQHHLCNLRSASLDILAMDHTVGRMSVIMTARVETRVSAPAHAGRA